MTYGRAISATTAYVLFGPPKTGSITTQVFLFDGRNGNNHSPGHNVGLGGSPSAAGIPRTAAMAPHRLSHVAGALLEWGQTPMAASELYTFGSSSGSFGRVTNVTASGATADVVSSLNDDGTVSRSVFALLSGSVSTTSSERFRNLSQRHAHAANFWKCNDS